MVFFDLICISIIIMSLIIVTLFKKNETIKHIFGYTFLGLFMLLFSYVFIKKMCNRLNE